MEALIRALFQFVLYFSLHQALSSSSFSSSAHSLCRHDQSLALLQFKHMLTMTNDAAVQCHCEGIPKIYFWNEGNNSDCCSWAGVTCHGLTGHVIELDLSCSWLSGTIHPNSSLFQLSHLRRLNLACNDFNGSPIPRAFGKFASLTHLNLSTSGFSGSVPPEIAHLSKLVSLDLSFQQLKLFHFRMLLKDLTLLQEIVLHDVQINSVLPNSLTNLSSLKVLGLSMTNLRGNLPNRIFYLPNLESLDLKGNPALNINFSNISWPGGSSLRELCLSSTNLSGELSNLFGHLKSLSHLDLSSTNLFAKLPDSIGNLKSLSYLDLSFAKLFGELPDSIGYLKSLKSLDLKGNDFSGCLPKSLGNLMQISTLSVQDNYFIGELPSSLSNLKQLTVLVLSYNNLTSEIPDVFAEFTRLVSLDLSVNNFSGRFPPSVANLKQLVRLDMSRNSLSGIVPSWLFTLPCLEVVTLGDNQLTGQIPDFQGSPLVDIDLANNKLHGAIPQSISNLANPTNLFLSSNNLSGVVDPQIFKKFVDLRLSKNNLLVIARSNISITFPYLSSFSMSSCNIEEFPDFLITSEKLSFLDLSNNKIHGQIPNWFGFIGNTSLVYLNLSHNFLTGFSDIKQLPWENLQVLDLHSNLLHGPLPIPPLSIQYFFISNNNLSGELPSSIWSSSSLIILDVSRNNFSGAIPRGLGNFSNYLSVLNLRSNGFQGTIPIAFTKVMSLRTLDLNGNKFEGPVPRSLASCKILKVLDLGNNMINGTFPFWLETLPELTVLVLRSNRFHGPIDTSAAKFPFYKLRIVDIAHNKFTGRLPRRYFKNFEAMKSKTTPDKKYMGDDSSYYHDSISLTIKGQEYELVMILTIFTTIDFSSNNFNGDIPNVIGWLESLKSLNFSQNNLTGHIPASLGNLTSLESLDISSNQVTGRIPSQLTSLTFLSVLNLSWNRLYGPIPQGSQFNTFENGSYAGNSGLCGFPLSKECENNLPKVQSPVLQHEDDSDIDGFAWRIVAIGYGCGVAVGIFLGSLMFLIGKPRFFVDVLKERCLRWWRTVADTRDRRN